MTHPSENSRSAADQWALGIVRKAVATMPASGRYGENNVFISSLWDRTKATIGLSLPDFKRWLAHQNQLQNLALVRADLVDDMDPDQVERSETEHLEARFHFVLDQDGIRRQGRLAWAEPEPEPDAKSKAELEQDIQRVARTRRNKPKRAAPATTNPLPRQQARRAPKDLYYPGGDGGGGNRTGKTSPVVLPHKRSRASCRLCSKYHTTAEHGRHASGRRAKK